MVFFRDVGYAERHFFRPVNLFMKVSHLIENTKPVSNERNPTQEVTKQPNLKHDLSKSCPHCDFDKTGVLDLARSSLDFLSDIARCPLPIFRPEECEFCVYIS